MIFLSSPSLTCFVIPFSLYETVSWLLRELQFPYARSTYACFLITTYSVFLCSNTNSTYTSHFCSIPACSFATSKFNKKSGLLSSGKSASPYKHQSNACKIVVFPKVLSPNNTVTFLSVSVENSNICFPLNCLKLFNVILLINIYYVPPTQHSSQ